MAVTSKVLARTAASTSSTTIYTTPSTATAIVTNIVVSNTTTAAVTFTVSLNGVAVQSDSSLAANSSAYFDLKQVLPANQTVTAFASSTGVNFHISGVEVV